MSAAPATGLVVDALADTFDDEDLHQPLRDSGLKEVGDRDSCFLCRN